MTDIETPGLGEDWDLAELTAERLQPTGKVDFYLAEAESAQLAVISKLLAKETDAAKVAEMEKDQAELKASRDSKKYTLHLTAIPSRMREDIQSNALATHKIERDVWGNEKTEVALKRVKYENNLIWFAQITGVEKNGRTKTFDTPEQVQAFADSLPTAVQKKVDETIKELTIAAEKFTVDSSDQAF